MSSAAERRLIPSAHLEQLREARSIIRQEADALGRLLENLDTRFCAAVDLLYACRGSVILTGMGKAGLIAQKIAATMSSTGTRARFLHPAEAVHGDLGCLHADDVVLALSNSGETEELCRLLPIIRHMGLALVAVTATDESTLGSQADVTVPLGRLREAGTHGLAPTTSTTAMLALGDALALVLSQMKGLSREQFAVYHPAGSLGQKLKTVGEVMRAAADVRIASQNATIREVFIGLSKPGRRTGAVMLVDDAGRLSGLFTDSDLARLLERRREDRLDGPICNVMTESPITARPDELLVEIVEILSRHKVSEIPVVDGDGKPIGLIDITDVIGQVPGEWDVD